MAESLRLRCRWVPILVLLACCLPIPLLRPSIVTRAILIGSCLLIALARPTYRRARGWVGAVFHPEAFLRAEQTFTTATAEVSGSAGDPRYVTTHATSAGGPQGSL